jgi:hypothetical protein
VEEEGIPWNVDLPEEFDESRPLTVVFATNCRAFSASNPKSKIDPTSVDPDGKLLVPFPDGAIVGLRPNVEIRFQFF